MNLVNDYYILKINGKNINRFIEKCRNLNINLIKISYISYKEIIIKIKEEDYKKIKRLKVSYKIKILNKTGTLRFKELIKYYKVFLIFCVFGLILLIFLSNIIFKVNVVSDNFNLKSKVKKDLDYYGIKKYSFVKSYNNIEKIKKEILNKYKNNIEWLEINREGVNYTIQIVERKKSKKEKISEYTNIVARKSGVIKNIFVENGVKVIENDNYVNKGDVIISGIIQNNEEVKGMVRAKGKVKAEVWYNINVEYPLKYKEKIYTDNKKKSFYLKIGNKYIEKKKFKDYSRNKIFSLSNKLVPFEIGYQEEIEIKTIEQNLTVKEAKNKAILKAKEKLMGSLKKEDYIIQEKTLNFYQKDSKIVLDIFFSCLEEIGKEESIIE